MAISNWYNPKIYLNPEMMTTPVLRRFWRYRLMLDFIDQIAKQEAITWINIAR